MCDATPDATIALPGTSFAPSLARDFLREKLCPSHGESAESAVKLVASELVTNAVLHGGPPVSVSLVCAVHEIRVCVTDGSAELPVLMRTEGQQRLGLRLVEKIARDWGSSPIPDGKVVWCAVPTGVMPARAPGRRRVIAKPGG